MHDPTENHYGDVGILAKYKDDNNNCFVTISLDCFPTGYRELRVEYQSHQGPGRLVAGCKRGMF